MAKRSNAKIVGTFVAGALCLLIAAVVIFGGGALFRRTRIAVAYFDGSVAGLSVGALVTYRGVPVGSVSKIVLEVSAQTGESRIPVYLQFQPGEITYTDGHELTQAAFEGAIRDGLRAQLVSQSFITGQLAVQLDYFPGTPIVLAGPKTSMIEIPTVPSTFQEIRERLSNLPLQNIAEAALGTLKSLDTLLQSPDTHAMLQDLSATIHQAQSLLETVRPQLTGVLKQADAALAAGERTADQLTDTVKTLQPKADSSLTHLNQVLGTAAQQEEPLIADLRAAVKSVDALAQAAQASLFSGAGVLATRSTLRQNTEDTMRNLAAASLSLRALAAELERNPNALILGGRR